MALLNDAAGLVPIAAALDMAIVVPKLTNLCQANFLAPTKIVSHHAEAWHLTGVVACFAVVTRPKLLQNPNSCLVVMHEP